jgi:WD40 repeat protein
VLTASNDSTARLWEAESGKLLVTFRGHTFTVHSAVFSLASATASGDSTARLWEAEGGNLAIFRDATVTSAVFRPDRPWVLTASFDGTVRLWAVLLNRVDRSRDFKFTGNCHSDR